MLLLQYSIQCAAECCIGLSLLCSKPYLFPYFPKFLPIIPFPKHHQLFLFYSIVQMIIITISDCFNRLFDCSIRVHRSFCKLCGRAQHEFGRVRAPPGSFWLHHCCISRFKCFSNCSFLFDASAQPKILEFFVSILWPSILKIIPVFNARLIL